MISIKHLRMEYGETVAIENLQLEIACGEVFGLIGGGFVMIDVAKTPHHAVYRAAMQPGRVDVGRHGYVFTCRMLFGIRLA